MMKKPHHLPELYPAFATTAVHRIGEAMRLVQEDEAVLTFHATEAAAREAMTKALVNGTDMLVLLRVEGMFRIKSVELDEIKPGEFK
jgi:hypothetical protein